MFTITKEFHFSASHQLTGLNEDHPCSRLHGHNYILKVELKGHTDDIGFVQDYNDLKPIKEFVSDYLDHKHLNDVFAFNPTSENICRHLFEIFRIDFPKISAIEISETPKTNCRYEPR